MNILINKVQRDQKILITIILAFMSSSLFTAAFVTLSIDKYFTDRAIILSCETLVVQIALITTSCIFFFQTKNIPDEDKQERAKFAYLLAMIIGFIALTLLILLRMYLLSGIKLTFVNRAKREYEERQIPLFIDKIKLSISQSKEIENTKKLLKNKHISHNEYNAYLWLILTRNNIDFKKYIDYDNQTTINKILNIVSSY